MSIHVDAVSKAFARRPGDTGGAQHAALDAVSVGIAAGQMLALVGPSGSGKTTLLRCIAGLEMPDTGTIRIGEREVFSSTRRIDVPTEERNLGLIFQSYALWPHMTVERNVAYPLRRRRVPDAEARQRVARYLDLVGCGHLAARFPHELSGGQQQRIALARALVYEPAVVLFDEPLSNLDPVLRERLRAQIREIQRSVGFTGVYVTHDQAEAFYVGDHIAILSEGEVLQAGTADEIYRRPANAHVATFVGASNRIDGVLAEDGRVFESPDLGRVVLAAARGDLARAGVREVELLCRPESLRFAGATAGPLATVVERVPFGASDEYLLKLPSGRPWRARIDSRTERVEVGKAVGLELRADEVLVYPRAASGAAAADTGEPV